ncbi:tyrosine--tRNA ligase [Micrococcus flavus]|uniref:Tyrosine--tRNA ligase n=1 Tax=Micrococcus flavus TaxID=384602 RepID=A0A4Y8X3X3_9MICC|nr:tyrosine--tRNA ligase [Micrococcus flavus]MBB4882429.1 tyrosyl-tRNA synthetase [Micrococcus flavus]TFI03400.1 tyrosine--tRNA ligase [Micrococcus flavus]GGK48774.1 tyrosine--tRNA ligase [Micrococcus flavus]
MAAETEPRAERLHAQANDPSFENVWQELTWRGLVHVSTDPAALEEALAGEPISCYCGFDPTAPSLHLGHLVQLLLMRRLQLAGHRPVALVGGATGLIGDPRQTSERVLNSREVVQEWVDSLRAQIEPYLSFEGDNAARMVNNLDWTAQMSALDFLREVGKNFRVGTMVKKEIVAKRLHSEEGISYTEFSYQVLQGNDYLELYRRHGVTLQSGGSDQWGNLTSGTELVRKVEGAHVHALGTPLITNADGTKFGKSEGNAIWLDAAMCSPYAFYQFWLNTADADVVDRLKVFTFLTRAEIEEYARKVAEEPFRREAQKRLAWEVTSLAHGEEATRKVIDASAAVFGGGDLAEVDGEVLAAVLAELPQADRTQWSGEGDGVSAIELLVSTGLVSSKSEARRTVKEGGASVNNVKVQDPEKVYTREDALAGRHLLVRRGKKNMAAADLTGLGEDEG